MGFFFGGIGLVILIALYFIFCYPLYMIAQKTNTENPWFAFIPILNLILMVQISGKELWWIILFFIPIANIVALIIIWMAIAERLNKPSWYGILMIVPFVNIVIPFLLAFG